MTPTPPPEQFSSSSAPCHPQSSVRPVSVTTSVKFVPMEVVLEEDVLTVSDEEGEDGDWGPRAGRAPDRRRADVPPAQLPTAAHSSFQVLMFRLNGGWVDTNYESSDDGEEGSDGEGPHGPAQPPPYP